MSTFANSKKVRADATVKLQEAFDDLTNRKINIFCYEYDRQDNSIVLCEMPPDSIELQFRGLVFFIWSQPEESRVKLDHIRKMTPQNSNSANQKSFSFFDAEEDSSSLQE